VRFRLLSRRNQLLSFAAERDERAAPLTASESPCKPCGQAACRRAPPPTPPTRSHWCRVHAGDPASLFLAATRLPAPPQRASPASRSQLTGASVGSPARSNDGQRRATGTTDRDRRQTDILPTHPRSIRRRSCSTCRGSLARARTSPAVEPQQRQARIVAARRR
jgi:hypothetical protein